MPQLFGRQELMRENSVHHDKVE